MNETGGGGAIPKRLVEDTWRRLRGRKNQGFEGHKNGKGTWMVGAASVF